jgi:hypothetical protein
VGLIPLLFFEGVLVDIIRCWPLAHLVPIN